jgi:hypothetical protein
VVRPGGTVFAAAISRWAPLLGPGSFSGFCHRPGQLRAELRGAGRDVADLVGIEGPAFLLGDMAEWLEDPAARAVVLEVARAVGPAPGTSRRPATGVALEAPVT